VKKGRLVKSKGVFKGKKLQERTAKKEREKIGEKTQMRKSKKLPQVKKNNIDMVLKKNPGGNEGRETQKEECRG